MKHSGAQKQRQVADTDRRNGRSTGDHAHTNTTARTPQSAPQRARRTTASSAVAAAHSAATEGLRNASVERRIEARRRQWRASARRWNDASLQQPEVEAAAPAARGTAAADSMRSAAPAAASPGIPPRPAVYARRWPGHYYDHGLDDTGRTRTWSSSSQGN